MSDSLEIVQIIITRLAVAGDGTDKAPYRRVTQLWTMGGDCFAEVDPTKGYQMQDVPGMRLGASHAGARR